MDVALLEVVSYLCFLVFLAGIVLVWREYSRMPLHLRWDLHPLPGEEVSDRADRKVLGRVSAILAEIRYALREGLLFEQCYRSNRGLWYATYPFHIGVFLSALWLVLLFLEAALGGSVSLPMRALGAAVLVSGGAGLTLGTAGCIGLLAKRLFDRNLRVYTAPREYVNLAVIFIVFAFGLATWIGADADFALSRRFARSLVTFSMPPSAGWLFWITATIFSLFFAVLPFASMKHGIAKFFTYHRVRWDDAPNLKGGKMEGTIEAVMKRPLAWSAPHIKCTNWQDVPGGGAGDTR